MSAAPKRIQIKIRYKGSAIVLRDVDPDSKISILRNNENQDCVFMYNQILLEDKLTYKSYPIHNNDTIFCISPIDQKPRTNIHCILRDIELEKQRLKEVHYMKLLSIPKAYRSAEMKFKPKEDDLFYYDKIEKKNVVIPPKLDKPLNCPLPMLWDLNESK